MKEQLKSCGSDFSLPAPDRIKKILYDYVKIKSFTHTAGERDVESFFTGLMQQTPYFCENPQYWGLYPLPNDPLGRHVCWAMVKGSGDRTVVLLHHYDIVDVEDYKTLAPLAFSPDALQEALKKHLDLLPEEARRDLLSDTYLFCRGGCDMKGGGSIQLALLEAYSRLEDFEGNVIVLGVPDEENLSAGMHAAATLLAELKKNYGLRYLMTINSEPHQRKDPDVGVFSEGSDGKMLPFVYVRGYLSHAGKVFEGLNPVSVLAEIVTRTEVCSDFTETVGSESSLAPTWLYMKDSKDRYDVSMPLTAQGCFSVLTLSQTPADVLDKVERICQDSFHAVIGRMNRSYRQICRDTGRPENDLPWECKVVDFKTLYEEALADSGETFAARYAKAKEEILAGIDAGELNMVEGNFRLIDTIYDYVEDISPRVVYGLLPPYYPNVSNLYFADAAPETDGLTEALQAFAMEAFGEKYTREYFFTGLCDLSYINIDDPAAQRSSIASSMPLFGDWYDIPFEDIKEISMAGINIGPWGKDFHKITERVRKEDLYVRTPAILDKAIRTLLAGGAMQK